VGQSPLP